MSGQSPKFNPAVLPVEFMKRFETTDVKEPRHFLYPGQVFVTAEPMTISTILGSCAAVCLWDMHKRAGGMNHYLLPDGPNEGLNRLRYGNVANPDLLEKILALGCEIRHLRAKIFGGSSAFRVDHCNLWDRGMWNSPNSFCVPQAFQWWRETSQESTDGDWC